DSVDLACVRHDVKSEVERSAPNKFDFCIPKLRIHLDHPASQKLGAPADRILALRKEGRSPTKQHSVIRCEPIVVKVVFRIINLAIPRAQFPCQSFWQNFSRDDVGPDWDDFLHKLR